MASQKEEKQVIPPSSSTSKLVQDVIASFNAAEKTWPTDVTLYTLPEEAELLPDIAQCHVIRALFACHGLMDCYSIERRHNAEFMAPKSRKLPFLHSGQSVVAYEEIPQFMSNHNYVLKSDMTGDEKDQNGERYFNDGNKVSTNRNLCHMVASNEQRSNRREVCA